MSTSLPEGIYPGCTAISGIAQPGAGMWVNIPGRGSSVRAIASNKIDSLTNLTVTVDRAGSVRVFGVGDRPPTLERTEAFSRTRRVETVVETTVRIAMTALVYFEVEGGGSSSAGSQFDWYVIIQGVPYLLTSQTIVTPSPPSAYAADAAGRSIIIEPPYLSATRDGTVYADLHNYDAEIDVDLNDYPRHNYHFQIQGGVVTSLTSSPSWRGDYVNNTVPRLTDIVSTIPPDPNPCIDFYRRPRDRAFNIYDGFVWSAADVRSALQSIFPGEIDDTGVLNYLKTNALSSGVAIQPLQTSGDVCVTSNYGVGLENRRFSFPRIQWDDIPAATRITIAGFIIGY